MIPSRLAFGTLAVALLGIFLFALRTANLGEAGRGADEGDRLDDIRSRGFLTCGVWPEVAGFSQRDEQGSYTGFDVDICRALAAAIFETPDKIQFVEAATVQEFLELEDVDVVSRRLTWELEREGALGLLFGPITFYDGQSFLVPRELGITRVEQLSGKNICVRPVSRSEVTLELHFRAKTLEMNKVLLDSTDELSDAFASGQCQAFTEDVSMLGAIRSTLAEADAFSILPEQISKEPLAQLVREDDDRLYDVLRWTVFALIRAEELGVTSENVDEMLESTDLEIKHLLGVIPGNGEALGLDERWAYNVIRALGNYGEMFERNVGMNSPIRMERGPNALWTSGGLMYAPPLR